MRERIKGTLHNHPTTYRFAKLADMTLRYALRGVHDPDYKVFANFRDIGGVFVDVGANVGQSALSFATVNRRMHIISFEANKGLEPDLRIIRRVLGRRFEYRMYGLGDIEATRDFYVPRVGRTLLTQEGTFSREELESETTSARIPHQFTIQRMSQDVMVFDDLSISPSLVKIDVQGYEEQVIVGMMAAIKRHHPMLMIERCSEDSMFHSIVHTLSRHGYLVYRYDPARNRLLRLTKPAGLNYFAVAASHENRLSAVAAQIIERN